MTTPSSNPLPPRRKRIRVEYTADFASKIDRVLEKQGHLEVALEQIRGSIMPRPEIDAEIEKRVSQSTYLADKTALENRLKHLEEAPSASWLRAGILISSGIGCLGLLGTCVGIIVTILIASHIIG